jgi:hypothetical protein
MAISSCGHDTRRAGWRRLFAMPAAHPIFGREVPDAVLDTTAAPA